MVVPTRFAPPRRPAFRSGRGPIRAALALLALGLAAAATGRPAAAEGFVSGIGDLPLMGGLAQDRDQDLLFDKPQGRIVQAVARQSPGAGRLDPASVRAFYAAALPGLGWRAAGPDRWSRDGESLALEFPEAGAPLAVRFMLSPL